MHSTLTLPLQNSHSLQIEQTVIALVGLVERIDQRFANGRHVLCRNEKRRRQNDRAVPDGKYNSMFASLICRM